MVIYMEILEKVRKDLYPSNDYIFDSIKIKNKTINIIYNEVLVDSKSINETIYYRLSNLKVWDLNNLSNKLPNCNIKSIKDKDIINYLNNGFIIIIYKNIYACEVRANLDRGVSNVTSELSLSGPKDSFSEVYNTNLGLIRRRIKSNKLKVENKSIGRITNTKVGILYIDGVVKMDLVNHIKKNLDKIDIDGIIDSSYLKNSLENRFNLFPTLIVTERPDKCSMALLEGKIVILVDNDARIRLSERLHRREQPLGLLCFLGPGGHILTGGQLRGGVTVEGEGLPAVLPEPVDGTAFSGGADVGFQRAGACGIEMQRCIA